MGVRVPWRQGARSVVWLRMGAITWGVGLNFELANLLFDLLSMLLFTGEFCRSSGGTCAKARVCT